MRDHNSDLKMIDNQMRKLISLANKKYKKIDLIDDDTLAHENLKKLESSESDDSEDLREKRKLRVMK